jgi:hypothetical protein
VVDYKGHAIWAESIMMGKLRAESKGHKSENITFLIGLVHLWNKLPADPLGTLACKSSNLGLGK